MKLIKRKAFSLLEISIVIIIIGVLIAGFAQAIEMFSEASIKSARNLSKLSRVSRIEDLTLWLDATASEAFDKEKDDNSKVSIWKDANAGASSIISSSSSSASLYPSYALSAINKLPAVSFKKTSASVGNCATVPNGSFVNSFENFTLYLIFSPKSLDDGIIIEKNNASATTFPFSLELLSGSYKFSVKNSTNTISVIGSIKAKINTPNLIRLSRIKGSQIEISIDGISSTETDTLTSSTLNNAELAIGCRNGNTPANFINGDIGETAFYNRNLNLKDKSDVEEYLYKKWKMKKFEGTLLTKTCNAPNANTTIDATSVNFTSIPISITCKEGYFGSPSYTCTGTGNLGTYYPGGTPCTAITCTAPASNGYLAQSSLAYTTAGSPGTINCDQAGYSGVSYTCTATGPATVTGSCAATTCTASASNGYLAQSSLAYTTTGSPGTITCDQAGYTGSVSYTCTATGPATVTGTCTAVTCTVPTVNTTLDATSVNFTTTATSLTCKTGFTGTPKYTCTGTGTYTAAGNGSCAPIKCYAIDRVGLSGTNYFDSVTDAFFPINYMVTNSSKFYIFKIWGQGTQYKMLPKPASLLPLVNRLKVYDVYHGSLSHSLSSLESETYGAIDVSKFVQTSKITPYDASDSVQYAIYGSHTLTKYARILDYGTNSFPCDPAYTGTLTYNCQTDASTLNPTSGTCVANTCSLAVGVGYSAKSELPIGSATFTCDASGYGGTISYTCPSSGGTATISGGSCTSAENTCSLAGAIGYSAKTLLSVGSTSFLCDEGYEGTINYTCPSGSNGGTATITSGSCTASPIKCYAKDKVGLSGTNYVDVVTLSTTAATNIMYIVFEGSGSKVQLLNSLGDSILPLVNRLKLKNNVYHGSLTYLIKDNYYYTYEGITPSVTIAALTGIPLFQYFISENSGYKVKGTHEFTKYARILGYGTSIKVDCDSGFTGTLTYSCTLDASTLDPTSGTCTAN